MRGLLRAVFCHGRRLTGARFLLLPLGGTALTQEGSVENWRMGVKRVRSNANYHHLLQHQLMLPYHMLMIKKETEYTELTVKKETHKKRNQRCIYKSNYINVYIKRRSMPLLHSSCTPHSLPQPSMHSLTPSVTNSKTTCIRGLSLALPQSRYICG